MLKCRQHFVIVFPTVARVAQLVEHSTDTRKVPGSTPGARIIPRFKLLQA